MEGGDHVSPEERTLYENEISFYDDSSDSSDDLIVANKENLVLSENSKFLNQIPKGILYMYLRTLLNTTINTRRCCL